MGPRQDAPDVSIAAIGRAFQIADGSGLLLEAEGLLRGERRALAIAVKTELAPLVAVTLLSALSAPRDDGEHVPGHGSPSSMLCLAAGVVKASDASLLRMHLQFDSGLVLPVEMPRASAMALLRGLNDELRVAGDDPGESDEVVAERARSRLG
ncbi:hypothetical protein BH11PSE8_BH11PSE8_18130 [soil metagenome]